MSRLSSKRLVQTALLSTPFFVTVEDKVQIKASPQDSRTLQHLLRANPEFVNLTYRPSLALLSGHQVSWMTGIATFFHRKVFSFLKCQRSLFALSDGGEVAIDSSF
mmetsp:Transcript_13229/g.22448  ORF Transcript_13229/g.22448 Transcript_13229/m.22448 type:complete len:106 (-) Transcript_13229:1468-1785(-)